MEAGSGLLLALHDPDRGGSGGGADPEFPTRPHGDSVAGAERPAAAGGDVFHAAAGQ